MTTSFFRIAGSVSKNKREVQALKPKAFIDTNVFYSAVLKPDSWSNRALQKAFFQCKAITSDYVVNELKRNIEKFFPGNLWRVDQFFQSAKYRLTVVDTPENPVEEEVSVRDINDHPIVRAAVTEQADIIISNDKDLKAVSFVKPRVLNVAEFLEWQP